MRRFVLLILVLGLASALAWGIYRRLEATNASAGATSAGPRPAPVEVGEVRRGPITLRRTFSGTLEASSEFLLAPKVSGRLQRLEADLGDAVTRGQVVAKVEDAEFVQELNQARADLDVARASHAEAQSALEIAQRALERAQTLRKEGVTSESQLDAAKTDELAQRARVEVTAANVVRAEAVVEAARIRLADTDVTADWVTGDDRRVVAQRFVDEGEAVTPSDALLSIVELNPITCVVTVPERDYARLSVGQAATFTTDAFGGERFQGAVTRIAPVFRSATRQARIELNVENGDERLKPGMFVRATLELESLDDATLVPTPALTERDDASGVFVVDESGDRVRWVPARVLVTDAGWTAVEADGPLSGRVVTLGQELCDDGSAVHVADAPETTP